MKNLNKKTAFTIAEILIALFVSGIIAILFIKSTISTTKHYSNSLLSYSAMDSLAVAVYDMAQVGCTTTPTTGDVAKGYCSASPGFLPSKDFATAGSRSFCSRLADEEFSTIAGTVNCANVISSETGQFDEDHMDFQTSNGMRFFGSGSLATGNPTKFYTIYVDIDGPKRTGRLTQTAAGKRDADVIKVLISEDGNLVLPDADGIAANDTDYLTGSVRYVDTANNKYVYVLTGVPYREAICSVDTAVPQAVDADYCSAAHGYSTWSQVSACNSGSGHTCEYVLDNPGILGNYIDINAIK